LQTEDKITNSGKILVVDFGSQTAHLITRRFKDLGIQAELVDPDDAYKVCVKQVPSGIIFSGGPSSVYEKNAPTISSEIFKLNIPILGICYGWQLMAYLMSIQGEEECRQM